MLITTVYCSNMLKPWLNLKHTHALYKVTAIKSLWLFKKSLFLNKFDVHFLKTVVHLQIFKFWPFNFPNYNNIIINCRFSQFKRFHQHQIDLMSRTLRHKKLKFRFAGCIWTNEQFMVEVLTHKHATCKQKSQSQ